MPTYEYACKECAEHLEVVQSFKDEPLTECPACGGPLRKVFAPVGIVLKGSGFYKTDSRAASKPAAKAGSGGGDAGGSSSTDGKATETKGAETKAAEGKSEKKTAEKAEGKSEKKAESKSA